MSRTLNQSSTSSEQENSFSRQQLSFGSNGQPFQNLTNSVAQPPPLQAKSKRVIRNVRIDENQTTMVIPHSQIKFNMLRQAAPQQVPVESGFQQANQVFAYGPQSPGLTSNQIAGSDFQECQLSQDNSTFIDQRMSDELLGGPAHHFQSHQPQAEPMFTTNLGMRNSNNESFVGSQFSSQATQVTGGAAGNSSSQTSTRKSSQEMPVSRCESGAAMNYDHTKLLFGSNQAVRPLHSNMLPFNPEEETARKPPSNVLFQQQRPPRSPATKGVHGPFVEINANMNACNIQPAQSEQEFMRRVTQEQLSAKKTQRSALKIKPRVRKPASSHHNYSVEGSAQVSSCKSVVSQVLGSLLSDESDDFTLSSQELSENSETFLSSQSAHSEEDKRPMLYNSKYMSHFVKNSPISHPIFLSCPNQKARQNPGLLPQKRDCCKELFKPQVNNFQASMAVEAPEAQAPDAFQETINRVRIEAPAMDHEYIPFNEEQLIPYSEDSGSEFNASFYLTPRELEKEEPIELTEAQKAREAHLKDFVTAESKHGVKNLQEMVASAKNGEFGQYVAGCMRALSKLKADPEKRIPEELQWKIYLQECADVAKKEFRHDDARILYKIAALSQPFAHQVWLEFAKMEKECGFFDASLQILKIGLKFNPTDCNLFSECVKILERLDKMEQVRMMLKRIMASYQPACAKLLLEGAYFEGRQGNSVGARKIFSFLLQQQKSEMVFLEYSRFEEREQNLEQAVKVCEAGFKELGMSEQPGLWFQYLKLYEKCRTICAFSLKEIEDRLRDSLKEDAKWKVHLELANFFDRQGDKAKMKLALGDALISTAKNQSAWKLWEAAARLLLSQKEVSEARLAFEKSCQKVPPNSEAAACLNYSKFFEITGDLERAEQAMSISLSQPKKSSQWQIHFQAIMMKVRTGRFAEAENQIEHVLKTFQGTGRLWSILIQLLHAKCKTTADFNRVQETFKKAILKIPKSGELWCEGARIAMSNHPANPYFSLSKAAKYLDFAVQFTPQYGDSFLEVIRVNKLIEQSDEPIEIKIRSLNQVRQAHQSCLHSEPNYGVMWFFFKSRHIDTAADIWSSAEKLLAEEASKPRDDINWVGCRRLSDIFSGKVTPSWEEKMKVVFGFEGSSIGKEESKSKN